MPGPARLPHDDALDLSVVAPAHNEQDNIRPLVEQVERALSPLGLAWEFVIVDDGSTDQTRSVVHELMGTRPWLRCIAMQRTPPGRGNGQSAAFHAGFRAARGRPCPARGNRTWPGSVVAQRRGLT